MVDTRGVISLPLEATQTHYHYGKSEFSQRKVYFLW